MAVKSKDEIMSFVNESAIDDDVKIMLLEDLTDSWTEVEEVDTSEFESRIADLEGQLTDLRERYKARFFEGTEEKSDEAAEDIEEVTEDDVIDIKEI